MLKLYHYHLFNPGKGKEFHNILRWDFEKKQVLLYVVGVLIWLLATCLMDYVNHNYVQRYWNKKEMAKMPINNASIQWVLIVLKEWIWFLGNDKSIMPEKF